MDDGQVRVTGASKDETNGQKNNMTARLFGVSFIMYCKQEQFILNYENDHGAEDLEEYTLAILTNHAFS